VLFVAFVMSVLDLFWGIKKFKLRSVCMGRSRPRRELDSERANEEIVFGGRICVKAKAGGGGAGEGLKARACCERVLGCGRERREERG
jgi:hypothetical protein